jgi:hypothetical protein
MVGSSSSGSRVLVIGGQMLGISFRGECPATVSEVFLRDYAFISTSQLISFLSPKGFSGVEMGLKFNINMT